MNEEKYCGYSIDDYLDEVALEFGIESDNGLAKKLGITRGAMSQYRSGKRVMDDYCASQIATFLKINPMLVIAAANEKREKNEPRREYWRNIQICLTTGGSLFYSALLTVMLAGSFSANSIDYKAFLEPSNIHYAQLCLGWV